MGLWYKEGYRSISFFFRFRPDLDNIINDEDALWKDGGHILPVPFRLIPRLEVASFQFEIRCLIGEIRLKIREICIDLCLGIHRFVPFIGIYDQQPVPPHRAGICFFYGFVDTGLLFNKRIHARILVYNNGILAETRDRKNERCQEKDCFHGINCTDRRQK
jgi:hypothetical protein